MWDELQLNRSLPSQVSIVHDLAEHIGKKLAKAEQMGGEGNVEESLKYMDEVEEIRNKKQLAEVSFATFSQGASG